MKKVLFAALSLSLCICLCACSDKTDSASSMTAQTESGISSQMQDTGDFSDNISNVGSVASGVQSPETNLGQSSSQTAGETTSDKQTAQSSSQSSAGASSSGGNTIIYNPSDNKIPEGCTYTTASGNTYMAGSMMPKEVCAGDKFEDKDYIYCYNRVCDTMFGTDNWFEDKNAPVGWSVAVKDTGKSSYSALRSNINGKPVTSLYCTFNACTSLVSAPAIPKTVTYMYSTFALCDALTTAPEIPEGVTNITAAFLGCEKLKTAPKIPDSVKQMSETFKNCTILESAPALPEGVTNLSQTFYQCRALKKAPRVPKNVLDMTMTFYECPLLEGEVVVDASPLYYDDCFRHTEKKITLSGESEFLVSLQKTSVAGNIEIKE